SAWVAARDASLCRTSRAGSVERSAYARLGHDHAPHERRCRGGRRLARPTGHSCRNAVRRAGSDRATHARARPTCGYSPFAPTSHPPGVSTSPPPLRNDGAAHGPVGTTLALVPPAP